MVNLNEYDLPNQCRAVAMLADNAAAQLRIFADNPLDTAQLKTTRNAVTLARDSLDGLLERLPATSKKSKARKL